MPISYRIDAPNRLVCCTATGVVTLDELEAYDKKLNADPAFNFKDAARVLWDFSAVTRLDGSAAKYVQLTEPGLPSANFRRALVAVPKSEVRKLLSLWVLHRAARQDPRVKLFDSPEKAREWLEQPE